MSRDYEQISVAEIRAILRDKYNITNSTTLAQKKSVLADLLLSLEDGNGVFDNVEAEVLPHSESEIIDDTPAYGSKEWSTYVLSQFDEGELFNGNPTCDGLRRVIENVIGPITTREVLCISSPARNVDIATVVVSVGCKVTNPKHPLYCETIVEQSIADCGQYNTEPEFAKHQSATAETRAEARCYRKMLRLRKVIAAEEATVGGYIDYNPGDKVESKQLDMVDLLGKRGDINIPNAIAEYFGQGKNIGEITKEEAAQFIGRLGDWAAGREEKRNSLIGYTQWR